jgi:hypothetical protein
MDIDSLIRLASHVEEEHRLGLYKRIADVCLFISGVFPDHATIEYNQPETGETLRQSWSATNRTTSDYEREGRLFYGLAEEHPSARDLALADIFGVLRQNFTLARKPLLYISSKYLHSRRQQLFGAPA